MTSTPLNDLLTELRARTDDMVEHARRLIVVESPSADVVACGHAVEAAVELCDAVLPAPSRYEVHQGNPVLRWGSPTPRVLLLGHVDTVWPVGTLERIPWSVREEDGRRVMRGPGVFDMKVGAVQAIHALACILERSPQADIGLLLTTDEEIGSQHSYDVIAESCTRAEAALVLEPSVDGLLKSARKGTSWYEVAFHGLAAHAGLDPENGINSLLAMARFALRVSELGDPGQQTTVTPTLAQAGTTSNTVPDTASVSIDVRAWTADEQHRVDAAIRALAEDADVLQGARAEVGGGLNRTAMQESSALPLVARLDALCPQLGLDFPGARGVGGASDGNITAALGVPTLDGLGAVGDGAHADHEWASVDAMPERAAMVAALVLDVLG